MLNAFVLWAQENAKAPAAPPAPFGLDLLPLLLIGAFAYFLLLRPAFRQEKERKQLRANLEKDDDVLTTSGIYGTVVSVSKDKDEVVVKVADGVRLKMVRAAIDRNLTKEEAARTAKGAKPSEGVTTSSPSAKNG
jgi:preprotein translocase subunit YajC